MRHEFISIGLDANFCDPSVLMGLEHVDIKHIQVCSVCCVFCNVVIYLLHVFQDKFPEKNGGLKDLFDRGPQCRFFLVKFWADITTSLLDDNSAFYGVTTQ